MYAYVCIFEESTSQIHNNAIIYCMLLNVISQIGLCVILLFYNRFDMIDFLSMSLITSVLPLCVTHFSAACFMNLSQCNKGFCNVVTELENSCLY